MSTNAEAIGAIANIKVQSTLRVLTVVLIVLGGNGNKPAVFKTEPLLSGVR